MGDKLKILFLCTGNSCRSQMAEGWTKYLKDNLIDACSAGIETHGLNPHAVTVMEEAGVDISRQKSKLLDELQHKTFDYVITVCGGAKESCPTFTGHVKNRIHIGFEDPAEATGTEDEINNEFRIIRDKILKDFFTFYNKNIR